MNILFLDDSPERTKAFRSQVPSATCVTTAAECIAALAEPWDVVFLDHDLGGETYADPDGDNTGSAVVRWVVRNKPDVKRFVVHTLNGPAGEAMDRDLALAGYWSGHKPFAWKCAGEFIDAEQTKGA